MRKLLFLGLLVVSTNFFTSCQKEDLLGDDLSNSKTNSSADASADRNGHHPHPTPVDVSQLPAAITDYVTANYAGSTIERAGTLPNGNYVVLVQTAGSSPVGLLFDASGNFLQTLPAPSCGLNGGPGGNHPHPTPVDVSQLPASITDYVTANYAGSTIERAGTLPNGNYVLLVQTAGSAPVGLLFDASGNFLQTLPAPIGG